MSKYRSTKRSTSSRSAQGPRFVFAIVVIIGVVIGARWFFSRDATQTRTTNGTPVIQLANDPITNSAAEIVPANVNALENGNSNTNVSTNANLNSNSSVSTDTKQAALRCTGAISQLATTEKKIALTFDMAADNDNVTTLLNQLKEKNISATFFVSGTFATKHPELTKRIASEFEMGNHGFATTSYASLTTSQVQKQITDTEDAFQTALGETEGRTPLIFRSPFGDTATTIVQGAKQVGYCTVLWTVDAFDWKSDQTATGAASRANEKLKPGAILLFHAGYDITAEAVQQVIATATEQGYSFATVSSFLSTGGD
jgi:peptidoglycan/xylan/chitin deacetylase (PgdA/CDA1 family)